MGRDPAEQGAPDLFWTDMVRDASSSATKPTAAAPPVADTSTQRHVLPKNLRHAVAQLSNEELDALCEVAVEEAKRGDCRQSAPEIGALKKFSTAE
jgi:hypothetical protein